MPSFGFGEVPAGSDVTHLVRTLEAVHRNPESLYAIEEATTSCIQWGGVLQQLMPDAQPFFFRKPNINIGPEDFNRIAEELRKGNAVLVSMKFPGSTNHVFAIEARENGTARILHAWQDKHQLRVERTMPVDEMVGYLRRLPELDWVTDKPELQNIRHQLWGADHAEVPDIGTSSRKRISYEMLFKGKPDRSLASSENSGRLTSLCRELSEWQSARSSTSGVSEWRSASSRPSQIEGIELSGWQSARSSTSGVSEWRSASSQIEGQQAQGRRGISIRMGAGVGAGLGFVLGAGGVLLVGHAKGERVDYVEVGLVGLKSGLAGGLSGGAGAAVARAGVSVVRSNVVVGFTMFGVFAIWDMIEWKMNEITEVQLRQRLAEGAGGAAGGIIGGAASGVAAGLIFGPVGAFLGVLAGGIAGGIGGAFAGRKIDRAIWNESEDAVMNSYEFFGWHDVKRNTRPTKSADEIGEAYHRKLTEKPKKVEVEDWHKFCLGNLMVLLPAIYPKFKNMMQLADGLQKKKSKGLSAIATAFYEFLSSE